LYRPKYSITKRPWKPRIGPTSQLPRPASTPIPYQLAQTLAQSPVPTLTPPSPSHKNTHAHAHTHTHTHTCACIPTLARTHICMQTHIKHSHTHTHTSHTLISVIQCHTHLPSVGPMKILQFLLSSTVTAAQLSSTYKSQSCAFTQTNHKSEISLMVCKLPHRCPAGTKRSPVHSHKQITNVR
jgi:hypothetical protein